MWVMGLASGHDSPRAHNAFRGNAFYIIMFK